MGFHPVFPAGAASGLPVREFPAAVGVLRCPELSVVQLTGFLEEEVQLAGLAGVGGAAGWAGEPQRVAEGALKRAVCGRRPVLGSQSAAGSCIALSDSGGTLSASVKANQLSMKNRKQQ